MNTIKILRSIHAKLLKIKIRTKELNDTPTKYAFSKNQLLDLLILKIVLLVSVLFNSALILVIFFLLLGLGCLCCCS